MSTSNPKLEVYKASAGSGKTYQLALKYICLLLGERREDGSIRLYSQAERKKHREILAITFTNKATNEMKQRIIKELMLLANVDKKSNYRKEIMKLTGASAETLANAARGALTSMLFDYGKIQVSTIDAFFQRVLRSFAYEANLSGNYELSLDDEEIISNAIADTLTQVCGFKSKSPLDRRRVARIRKWVEQIIDNRYSNAEDVRVFDKDNGVRTALVDFIKSLNNETFKCMAKEMDKFFTDPDAIDNLIAALNAKLLWLKQEIDKHALNVQAIDIKNASILKANERKWVDGTLDDKPKEPSEAFVRYISGDKGPEGMCRKDKATPDMLVALGSLLPLLRQYWTVRTMLNQMYNLGLFHEVLDVAARMKVHLNTILLSDTNTMLNEIIGGSETPFIYERIGERLHHFLIDEFQDTSMLQWENLRPLVANSLGEGYDDMIIGDVKQCIYRFRNSYPELLDTKLEKEERLSDAITLPTIDTNWRSAVEVVNFNSDAFENIGRERNIHSYDGVRQKHKSDALDGYVDVVSSADFDNECVSRMVENMSRQLKSGYLPSDIVVLVRWKRLGAKIVKALQEHTLPGGALEGLSIVSSESLFLKYSNAVIYIIAQLRELDRIWNPIAPAKEETKRSTNPRATERELDWIKEALRMAQSEGLEGDDAIEAVMQKFDNPDHPKSLIPAEEEAWREQMRGRALYEVVEKLVENLPDPTWRGTEPQYIVAFQDLVADYSHKNAPSIHGFLQLWDEKLEQNASVGLAEGSNAIRILTVHSSKGLEFDCVHLVLDSDSFESETDYRWYDAAQVFEALGMDGVNTPDFFPLKSADILNATMFKGEFKRLKNAQLLDELNALYVAMTRAKRELVATFKAPPKSGAKGEIASTILRKGLLPKYPHLDEREWRCVEGAPTSKVNEDDSEEKEVINTLLISEYTISDRLDAWHSTKVNTEELKEKT